MNLIIDQGNSITKMALFRAGRLQNVYFYPKWDSTTVIDFLDAHEVDAAIFSTVTEYDPEAIATATTLLFKIRPFIGTPH